MQSMLLLGGLGACPPRKILKIAYSEADFCGNFTRKSSSRTSSKVFQHLSMVCQHTEKKKSLGTTEDSFVRLYTVIAHMISDVISKHNQWYNQPTSDARAQILTYFI